MSSPYDVFLSYNSRDLDAVRQLAERLRGRGVQVWLDDDEILPGLPFQEALEEVLRTAPAAAIVLGEDGLGPWQEAEMRELLVEARQRDIRLVPVLLPGAGEPPLFLRQYSCTDLRGGTTPRELDRLVRALRPAAVSAVPLPEPDDDDPALAAYAAWADARHRGIRLIGVGAGDVELRLEQVYVPLRIATQRTPEIDKTASHRRGESVAELGDRDLALGEIFTADPARPDAVILGHPGAGKTTVLRKLQCLADASALGLDAGTLPVFLRLRRLEDDDFDAPFEAFLQRELAELSGRKLAADLGSRLWRRGRLLLLCDGLDEIADDTRRARAVEYLEWWLGEATARGVRAVTSCRYTGYGGDVRFGERFLHLDVRPLDAAQCRQLVELWFREAQRALPRYTPSEARAAVAQLTAALDGPDYGSQRLKVLVGSPLLLTLLCVVVLRGGEMPRQRVAFYDQCLRVLLSQWGRSKARDEEGWEPLLDVDAALAVLRALAWELHRSERRDDLYIADLLGIVKRRLRELGRSASPMKVVRWLEREAGVIEEYAPRYFGLVHLGVQEYLAALHVASRGEELLDEIAGHYDDEWWYEVILLLVGLPGRHLFAPFMERLLGSPALLERADLVRTCLDEAAEADVEPLLDLLDDEEPRRQAAVLRLLRGRLDPRGRERIAPLAESSDRDVAALAQQILAEIEARPDAALERCDVLVLHHPADTDAALELTRTLRQRGLDVVAAAEDDGWVERFDELLAARPCVAAAVGPSALAPWEEAETLSPPVLVGFGRASGRAVMMPLNAQGIRKRAIMTTSGGY